MGWIRTGFQVTRATSAASRRAGERVAANAELRRAERLPNKVRRRGYLVPGDGDPPPGFDLLDYRGLSDRSTSVVGGVTLGAGINLRSGQASGLVSLGIDDLTRHLAVVAPPGQGKTYGLIAPMAVRALRAGATVVALDVTGDLVPHIKAYASESQTGLAVPFRHWSTDPDIGKHRWNPLSGLDPDDETSLEAVRTAILGTGPDDPRHRFFHDRELRILGGVLRLLLSIEREPTVSDLLSLTLDRRALSSALERSPDRSLSLNLYDYLSADNVDAPGMVATIQTKLAPFVSGRVQTLVSASDFDLEDVISRPSLLVVGAELRLGQRGEIASALAVNRLVGLLTRRYGRSTGVPVILLLDEAPVLAKRIELGSMLATLRATRTGIVLAAQNVAQFGGEDERSVIFDACDSMMLLPGASDVSIRMFQSRLGQREVGRRTVGREFGRPGGSVNISSERVERIGARELIEPPFGTRPAFLHSRSVGAGPIALELDRTVVSTVAGGRE